jgi:hypothetical protein
VTLSKSNTYPAAGQSTRQSTGNLAPLGSRIALLPPGGPHHDRPRPDTKGLNQQGASEMQALLILLICLVTLAVLANRYGVDSRDGLDWSPPDRARSR